MDEIRYTTCVDVHAFLCIKSEIKFIGLLLVYSLLLVSLIFGDGTVTLYEIVVYLCLHVSDVDIRATGELGTDT